jgi:hypothetical protein
MNTGRVKMNNILINQEITGESRKIFLTIEDIGNLINMVNTEKARIDTIKSSSYVDITLNKIHALMYLDLLLDKLMTGLK